MFADASGENKAFDYDRFVDWDKRLLREGPFFRREFADHGVKRVVDVGCGTGRHAVMFSSWGLESTGVDPSEEMLTQAREYAARTGSSARFVEGGFGGLTGLALGGVDAVVCTGNALPHVDGIAGLDLALADFAEVLDPGGLLVLHLLNHDRLLDGAVRSMAPVVRDGEDGKWVFLRVMDVKEGVIQFDFLTLHLPAGGWDSGAGWEVSSRRSPHTALPTSVLVPQLRAAGFGDVHLYGDHSRKEFDPAEDESVIVTATKT